jgi:hypothetical protein
MKSFEDFLVENDVAVENGRILIRDAGKISDLQLKYDIQKVKEEGLPKSLEPKKDVIVKIEFEDMERKGQKPDYFKCELIVSTKNYDDDTWNGLIKGTVQNVWKWAIAESGLDPSIILDNIEITLETLEDGKDEE